MVIGFLLIWLPYACVSLLETVGKFVEDCIHVYVIISYSD